MINNTDIYNDVLRSYYNTSFLCHHGILGMKWGIRRFQNKDGTLTEAGKKRYESNNPDDVLEASGYKPYHFKHANKDYYEYRKTIEDDPDKPLVVVTSQDYSKIQDADQARKSIEVAEKAVSEVKQHRKEITDQVVEEMYDRWSKYWNDSDNPISRETFSKGLILRRIEAADDEFYSVLFDDKSDLFLGHIITVDMDKRSNKRRIYLEG